MTQPITETASVAIVSVSGGVHGVPPVSVEPHTVMTRWSLRQVMDAQRCRTRHLVGWAQYEGRVCSPIVRFDLEHLRATTESGRQYQLKGPPGYDGDAEYVFSRWLGFTGCTRTKDLTASLLRLCAKRGFRHFA